MRVLPLRIEVSHGGSSVLQGPYAVGGFGDRLTCCIVRISSVGSWQKIIGLAPGTLRSESLVKTSCLPTEIDLEVARAGSKRGSRVVANFIAAVGLRRGRRVDVRTDDKAGRGKHGKNGR